MEIHHTEKFKLAVTVKS